MKKTVYILVFIFISIFSFSKLFEFDNAGINTVLNSEINDSLPPPNNVHVDSLTSIVTWEEPDTSEFTENILIPLNYHVFLDSICIGIAYYTYYELPYIEYGTDHEACVKANYINGFSAPACDSFTSVYLSPPRNLNGDTWDDAVELWWEVPLIPDTTKNTLNRDQWDVHFIIKMPFATCLAGVETDGNYIYASSWNCGQGTFFTFGFNGNYYEEFTIQGCQNVRDLAYEDSEMLMYGSNASNTVWGLDFIGHTVVNTINAPIQVRAIAYDSNNDGFWANNWSTDITLFDKTGALIQRFSPGAFTSIYGFAYDPWTDGGPYLWAFSQDLSGAELVQYEIATGTAIFNMSVYPYVGGSAIAGGLFTHCSMIYPNKVTIGGMLQSEYVFGLELGACANFQVPDNLLGYKLFKNDTLLDYILFNGEDTTYYNDTGLEPLTYKYDVTAIYDLSPYGFPGDTGESIMEGPLIITVRCCHPLPFEELWTSGTFELNMWEHEERWEISGQSGNPEPSAEFKGSFTLNNYSSSLTSCYLDGGNQANPWIDGHIWLDFDIKLDAINSSGNEKMVIKILTENSQDTIIQLCNDSGSFDWQHYHFNITQEAFTKIFRISFETTGIQSYYIQSWMIDNIYIYRSCPGPQNLDYDEYSTNQYVLFWEPPQYNGYYLFEIIQGYNVYLDGTFLDFTQDTFYYWNPVNTGDYIFEVSAIYEDCESDTLAGPITINVFVGIEEYNEDDLEIFPNPANELVKVSSDQQIKYILLHDLKGNIILNKEINDLEAIIPVSELNNGVYSIQVRLGNGSMVARKVVVMH
jgi:hypothetical protein